MKEISKVKINVMLIVIMVIIGVLVVDYTGMLWHSFIGVKKAAVERKVFKETRSYNEGKIQDLIRYRLQYIQAKTKDEKEAIAETIRMMFADYPLERIKDDKLREFLEDIKYNKEVY